MLLTGPKASGKTLCCQLIRHRLDGSSYKVVYLENPVGSFDELLGRVCLQLGMPLSVDIEQDMIEQDITAVLQTLLSTRKEKGKRVLLLIDEAEKMFLATLERLFRLLNELNKDYGVQAILIGQPALNSSLEQLSGYCEGVRIVSSYRLEAFSSEETGAYLAYRLKAAGGGTGRKDAVFSEKAVQEIFLLGQGLPGIMDGIAEAALETAAAAGADSVLPVHVTVPNDPVAFPGRFDDEESSGRYTGLLLLLALCLLVFFFFGQTSFFSNQEEAPQEVVQESINLQPENTEIQLALPEKDKEVPLPFALEETTSEETTTEVISLQSSTEQNEAEKPSLLSLPIPQRPEFKRKDGDEEKEDLIVVPATIAQEDTAQSLPEEKTPQQADTEQNKVIQLDEQKIDKTDKEVVAEIVPEIVPEVVIEAVEETLMETRSVLAPDERTPSEQTASAPDDEVRTEALATAKKLPVIKPTWIIELAPGMKKRRPPAAEKPARSSEQKEKEEAATAPPKPKTLVPVASARGVVAPAVSTRQQAQTPAAVPVRKPDIIRVPKVEITPVTPLPHSTKADKTDKADQLFARYLGVGNRWTKKTYGNKFTVQLLVLSSNDAADKIKNMIIREEYQEHTRKLSILRRDTLPPTLFVCYGVYSSMDEARNARNAMPLFLRKHHPYALSISDVLAKTRD